MKGTLKRLLIVLIAISMVIMPSSLGFTYADETTGEAVSEETADVAAVETGDAVEGTDLSDFHLPRLGEAAAAELGDEEETSASLSGIITKEELDSMSEAELDETVRVSIVLSKAPVLDRYSVEKVNSNTAKSYRKSLKNQQLTVEKNINKVLGKTIDVKWNLTLALNVMSAEVTYRDIKAILDVKDVESVQRENRYEALVDDEGTAEPNTSLTSEYMVGAQAAWADGFTGAGSRIAIIDTGIDVDHQSFNSGAFDYAIGKYEDKYNKTVDLMDDDDIEAVAEDLNGAGVRLSSKIPYAYNYVDENTNVTHLLDEEGEHGSHVAGIAAANRYIPSGDSYVDTLDGTYAVGMAPDAQLLVMKVFGVNGGAYDSDYMAAIEDAILLECDSCNLSLGSAAAGFTYDTVYQDAMNALADTDLVAAISAGNSYDWGSTNSHNYGMLYADSTIFNTVGSPGSYLNAFTVAAAQNVGLTGAPFIFGDEKVFYTETDSTGAEMRTLDASADGTGTEYDFIYIDGNGYEEEYAAVNAVLPLAGKMVMVNRGGITFSEKANNAMGPEGSGYKPEGLVVVNNANGSISMNLDDYEGPFPVVSVNGEDKATIMAVATLSQTVTTQVTYDFDDDGEITDDETNVEISSKVYTGKMMVTGKIDTTINNEREDATITDFSSWGVPESLILKPEITAPGGGIYSVYGLNTTDSEEGTTAGGHDKYELMSGTSMAAPHIAGLSAVMKQYLKEADLSEYNEELTDNYTLRAIAQSLLMSTATPMRDTENDLYLPVIQQGAGLAEVSKAIKATSVVMIDEAFLTMATGAAADGKVKVELGDDPDRSGVYKYAFTIYNITNEDQTFELDSDFFTQDLYYDNVFHDTWTKDIDMEVDYQWEPTPKVEGQDAHDVDKDGDTDEADAQAILDYLTGVRDETGLDLAKGEMDGDNKLTTYDAHLLLDWTIPGYATNFVLPANGKATVYVTAYLDDYLDDYPAGAYIEGYTYANCVSATEEGLSLETSHSIPVLGFYGNWTESSMFDYSSYADVLNYGDEWEDYVWPSYSGKYSNYFLLKQGTSEFVFTGNPYVPVGEDFPYDRLAMRSDTVIRKVAYNLIRDAADTGFAVSKLDEEGGIDSVIAATIKNIQVYGLYTDTSGTQQNTGTNKYTVEKTPADYGLKEGDLFRAGFYAIPEYYAMIYNSENNGDGSMTDAYSGVLLEDEEFAELIGEDVLGPGAYVGYDFVVDDTLPVLKSAEFDAEAGEVTIEASDNEHLAFVGLVSLDGHTIYAYDIPEEADATVVLDIADIMNDIPKNAAVFVGDYAGNEVVQLIQINDNEPQFEDPYAPAAIEMSSEDLTIYKGNTGEVSAKVIPITATNTNVIWSSADETVATVSNGTITAVAKGETDIIATSEADPTVIGKCHVTVLSFEGDLYGVAWDFKIEGNENESIIKVDVSDGNNIPRYTTLGDYKGISTTSAFYGYPAGSSTTPSEVYVGTFDYSDQATEIYKLDSNYNFVDNNTSTEELDPYGTAYFPIVDSALGSPQKYARYKLFDLAFVYGPYAVIGNADPSLSSLFGLPSGLVGLPLGLGVHPNYATDDTYWCAIALKTFVRNNPTYYLLDDTGMLWQATTTYNSSNIEFIFNFEELFYIGFEPNWLRQSMYYDPKTDALYLSYTDAGVGSTLYYIDVDNETVLEIGEFGDDVWPVTGLYTKNAIGTSSVDEPMDAEDADIDLNLVQDRVKANMAELDAFKAQVLAEGADGSTNKVVGTFNPEKGERTDLEKVFPYDTPYEDEDFGDLYNFMYLLEDEDSTNGFATIEYDPEALVYLDKMAAIDHTSVFVDEENGLIKFAYADKTLIEAYSPIELLLFGVNACEDSTVTSTTTERNDDLDLEEVETDIVEGLGHDLTKVDAVAATCTEAGNSEYWVCENCGKFFSDAEGTTEIEENSWVIEALGHAWDEGKITKEPTCTEDGVKTYTCTRCGETKTETIEALGHAWDEGKITKEPTCTEDGVKTYTCTRCGETKTETIVAIGHDWDTENVVWNWSEDLTTAEAVFSCKNDSTHTQTITATVTSETADGVITYTATAEFNGATYTDQKKVEAPVEIEIGHVRIQGSDRYDTAFQAADYMKQTLGIDKFKAVIVADGRNFADALSGSYLAAVADAPILLAHPIFEQKVFDYIKANTEAGGKVYILGGPNAVSKDFENMLKDYTVERLGGADRFATNVLILNAANKIDGTNAKDVLVCSGMNFADALSTSSVGKPILLVGKNITDGQKQYLTDVNAENAWIIGGEAAVNKSVEGELATFVDKAKTKRLAGTNRYETSYMVAHEFATGKVDTAVLVYGQNFPDGLSGGAVASVIGSPVLLAMNRDDMNAFVAKWVTESGAASSITLGGPGLISDDSIKSIMNQPNAEIKLFKEQ